MDNKDFILDNDEDFLPIEDDKEKEEVSKVESNTIPLDNILNNQDNINPSIEINNTINDNIFSSNEEDNLILVGDVSNNQSEIITNNEPLTLTQTPSETIQPEIKENKIKTLAYKYAKGLPVISFIFVSILGVYIFINNVKADIKNLIKIEEKSKIGYIDDNGKVIVKPKFLYGSDFYKGYAVVKNYNNLYGVIDGKGNNEIAFGNIFSADLYSNRYIVTKFTNEGLKMGLLNSNLKEITRFKYDNLSYSKSGVFMYVYDDTIGILNNDGKEIYSYKVDEVDDKDISVEVSNIKDNKTLNNYAKVKVNSSSTIINLSTGKEVYKYTLDDIRVLDNNVFYINNKDGNNRYFVIKDDKVVYQTDGYKRLRVEDIDSDIAIAIKDDVSIDYINLLTREKINKDGNVKYTYSDGVVLEEMYNFQSGKTEYKVITPNGNIAEFNDINLVDNEFINGYAKIKTKNDKYNFINKKGNIISNKEYETVSDFNKNGYAVVSNDNSYGIINSSGKEVVDLKYDDILQLDENLFNNISKKTKEQLFIFKENDKYGIINSNGKVVIKPIYDEFKTITTKYPIIKAEYEGDYVLLNLETHKDLGIVMNADAQIYEDYIIANNEYYNYNGELIYSIGG